ncbi:MAG: CotH kinase family protein [Muribaculum sp.]|nr:CotH kinase family protein [Muribaculum sp.]
MKHVSFAFFLGVAIASQPIDSSGQVVINEIMQSNFDALFADNEFPDSWVEVYNMGNVAVDLEGYKIGASENVSKSYEINTSVVVPAKGHGLIFCDKAAEGVHADFRLESTKKGSVFIFSPAGDIVDRLDYGKMPAPNVGYGRESDGGDTWGYMITPTPGQRNSGGVSETLLGKPEFSVGGGVYDSPVEVTVRKPDGVPGDCRLCITVDGREPVADDAVTGDSKTFLISKSTSLRAKLISPSALSTVSVTHSYIFHPRATDLPVVSVTLNPEYLYDDKIGILMGELDKDPNWGHDWRRPMNVEYFDGGNHDRLINQIGETRVKGGWSRRYSQKSLVFYANKRFGEKRYNTAGVWRDKPEVTSVKSFELRNSGTDFEGAHVRDAFAQRLAGLNSPHVDWQGYRLVICYVNGEYRGVYDLRERTNEDYIESNYDGLEDIDMVENWWEVKNGTANLLWEFIDLYNRKDVTFDRLKEVMDVDNFLDMFTIETFAGNTDYPNNNIVCWKPWADGAKWRWVLKDIDRFAITWEQGQHEHDYFRFIADMASSKDYDEWTRRNVRLFALFMELPEARSLFIDRLAIAMGDYLQPDYVDAMLDEMVDELRPEYSDHCKLYFSDNPWKFSNWEWEVSFIHDWCKKRRIFLYDRMRTYFGLSSAYTLKISGGGEPVTFNGVALNRQVFDGQYYNGKEMTLSTAEGRNWKVTVTDKAGRRFTEYTPAAVHTFNFSDAKSVEIESVPYNPASIDEVEMSSVDVEVEVEGLEISLHGPEGLAAEVYGIDGTMACRISGGCSGKVAAAGVYVVRYVSASGLVGSVKVRCR